MDVKEKIIDYIQNGASFLMIMIMHRHLDEQLPLNSKIHNSLRRPNLPTLEIYVIKRSNH